eukprot:6460645-Amphidinium_carterae.2
MAITNTRNCRTESQFELPKRKYLSEMSQRDLLNSMKVPEQSLMNCYLGEGLPVSRCPGVANAMAASCPSHFLSPYSTKRKGHLDTFGRRGRHREQKHAL